MLKQIDKQKCDKIRKKYINNGKQKTYLNLIHGTFLALDLIDTTLRRQFDGCQISMSKTPEKMQGGVRTYIFANVDRNCVFIAGS